MLLLLLMMTMMMNEPKATAARSRHVVIKKGMVVHDVEYGGGVTSGALWAFCDMCTLSSNSLLLGEECLVLLLRLDEGLLEKVGVWRTWSAHVAI